MTEKPAAPPAVGDPVIEATANDWEQRAKVLDAMIHCVALPDSRTKWISTPRGAVPTQMYGWMVPIACMSCGKDCGLVPQENMTFVGWLCAECEPKYGHIDGFYLEPDRIHWARLEMEQLNTYGRRLSDGELAAVAQDETSPLATLIQEGRTP